MIKNIIFDIGMVLADFQWRRVMESLKFPTEVIETLRENMIENELWNERDRGTTDEEEIIKKFKEKSPDLIDYIDRFFEHKEEIVVKYPFADEWVKSYKDRGYNVYILSNYSKAHFEVHSKYYDFLNIVDGAVISYKEKVVKPDEKIYNILLQRYSLKAEECVFLDDREQNIAVAKKIGMQGIVVKSHSDAVMQLEKLLKALI